MIYAKTEAGQQVLKQRGTTLSPRQRSAFILFDGQRSVSQVLAATAALGITQDDIRHMVDQGLLQPAPASSGASPRPAGVPAQPEPSVPQGSDASPVLLRSPQRRYQDAYPIAIELTSALGLRGLRLNLAVEGALDYDQLKRVAERIRDAVGAEKYARLHHALMD